MVLRTPPTESAIARHPILRLTLQGATRRFRLLDPTWLGSDPSCQVRVDGPNVFGRHAVLRTENGRWLLEADADAPAIELNGLPIRSAWLAHGDRVTLGDVTMSFEIEGEAPVAPSRPPLAGVGQRLSRDGAWEFARRLAALDYAWAEFRAERRDGEAKIAQRHAEIDQRERHQAEQAQSAWRQFVERQAEWEAEVKATEFELRRKQLELENRSASLAVSEQEIQKARASLDKERGRLADDRERLEAEHQHLKGSALKMVERVRQQEAELTRGLEQFAEEKKAWEREREEQSTTLEVARRELEARSKRSLRQDQGVPSIPLADAGVPVVLTPASLPPMERVGWESLRSMASAVERRLSELESMTRRIELAERSLEEERGQLRQRANVLEVREKMVAERERASKPACEPTFDQSREAAMLHRQCQELAIEARRLQADRANYERSRTLERNAHFEESKKLERKRGHLARTYRDRARRLREKREQIRLSEKRLMGRIALMMRLDGELAVVREELVAERMATLRALENPMREVDWDSLKEENEQARRRLTSYVARVEGILSRLEGERGPKSATGGMENELARARLSLREIQSEAVARQNAWREEKRLLLSQISSLEEEVESLAASLLGVDEGDAKKHSRAAYRRVRFKAI